jgi:hypothetical protein
LQYNAFVGIFLNSKFEVLEKKGMNPEFHKMQGFLDYLRNYLLLSQSVLQSVREYFGEFHRPLFIIHQGFDKWVCFHVQVEMARKEYYCGG